MEVNRRAVRRYVPGQYGGKVTLIRSHRSAYRWALDDLAWDWGEVAQEVEVHLIEAGHEDIVREPKVRLVGAVLQECLRRARDHEQRPELVEPGQLVMFPADLSRSLSS